MLVYRLSIVFFIFHCLFLCRVEAEEVQSDLHEIHLGSIDFEEENWDGLKDIIFGHIQNGEGVMLILSPGLYHSPISLQGISHEEVEAPLIIRASEVGKVIFQPKGGSLQKLASMGENVWKASWSEEMEGVRFFQGDFLFEEVSGEEDLIVGTYFFDRANSSIQLIPFRKRGDEPPLIEYVFSERQSPFVTLENLQNCALRGIVFRRMGADVPAVFVDGVDRLEITACQFLDGLGDGLVIRNSSNVSLSDLKSLRNQNAGIHLFDTSRVVFEGVEASFNEGYGILSEYGGESYLKYTRLVENQLAGWKIFEGRGIWSFESGFAAKNREEGIFIDSENALLSIKNAEISFNFGAGIRIASLASQIMHTILVGNGVPGRGSEPLGQISLSSVEEEHLEHYWKENVFLGTTIGVPLLNFPLVEKDFSFLKSGKNLFYQKEYSELVRLLHIGLDLSGYQAITGADLDSFEADPLFYNIDEYDYQPFPESPIFKKADWPVAKLEDDPALTYKEFLFNLQSRLVFNEEKYDQKKFIPIDLERFSEKPSLFFKEYGRWPFLEEQIDNLVLDGVPILAPFEDGFFLKTAGLWEEVFAGFETQPNWSPDHAVFRDESLFSEPIKGISRAHFLVSMQGAFDTTYHANLVFKDGDREVGRIELKSPPEMIPLKINEFSDFLNSTTIQNTERTYFHFTGTKTRPYPLIKTNEKGKKEIFFLYKAEIEFNSSRETIRSIILSTNASSEAKVFVHGITLER